MDPEFKLLIEENTFSQNFSEDPFAMDVEDVWLNVQSKSEEEFKYLRTQSPSTSPSSRRGRGRRSPLFMGERTKKTEELDKFWLRAFREYLKKNFSTQRFNLQEKLFWEEYFSDQKLPGKGKEFRSYGKRYKMWLFNHEIFAVSFAQWFSVNGAEKLKEKRAQGTSLYDEYYNYAKEDLLTYFERLGNHQISPMMSPSPKEYGMDVEEEILEYNMSPEDFVDAALG